MKSWLIKGCLLVCLVLSLSGCAGTGPAEGANVPNVLRVIRNSVPGYHFATLSLVIRDEAQVQSLYKAAYALEKIPSGEVFSCPMDNGLEYELDFLHAGTFIQQMKLDATGCRFIDINATGYDFPGIITTHDARFTTPSFRTLLANMLNLSSLNPSDS